MSADVKAAARQLASALPILAHQAVARIGEGPGLRAEETLAAELEAFALACAGQTAESALRVPTKHVMSIPTRLRALVRAAIMRAPHSKVAAAIDVIDTDIGPYGLRVDVDALAGRAGVEWACALLDETNAPTVQVEPFREVEFVDLKASSAEIRLTSEELDAVIHCIDRAHVFDGPSANAEAALAKLRAARGMRAGKKGPTRDDLGRWVRKVWIEWAREQANPKPHWLLPWEELGDADKDVDMRIGETLFIIGRRMNSGITSVPGDEFHVDDSPGGYGS